MAKKKKKGLPKVAYLSKKKMKAKKAPAALVKKAAKAVAKKTAPKKKLAKVPDYVTGKFVIVSPDGGRVLTEQGNFRDWASDPPPLIFPAEGAASDELLKQQAAATATGIEDGISTARVAPLKQFLANTYDFDFDRMEFDCCTVTRGSIEIVSAKLALKAARSVLNDQLKQAQAVIKVENKRHAQQMKDHLKGLAQCEKDLAKFEVKALRYGP